MKKVNTAVVVSTDTHYLHHIHIGRFDLATDEPKVLGGQGQAPAPFDYYLASLSACTAITLCMYAERKGWNLGEFRAELALSFDDDGKVRACYRGLRQARRASCCTKCSDIAGAG